MIKNIGYKKIIFIILALSPLFTLFLVDRVETENFLQIKDTTIKVEIADDQKSQLNGLSNRNYLDSNSGMLFIFDREDFYGIWMKEMNFPIDIAWINKDKVIIHIERNVLPETFPNIFKPDSSSDSNKALYVLEVNANFFEANNINLGDLVIF